MTEYANAQVLKKGRAIFYCLICLLFIISLFLLRACVGITYMRAGKASNKVLLLLSCLKRKRKRKRKKREKENSYYSTSIMLG